MPTIEREVLIDGDADDMLDCVNNDLAEILFKVAEQLATARSKAETIVITKDDVSSASRFVFQGIHDAIDKGEVDAALRPVLEMMEKCTEGRKGTE